tara:strand:+ start:147 stop:302 length:156 start_codon:yes stop_codon:yes gene_type:complete
MNEEELIKEISDISDKLNGVIQRYTTYDSTGKSSKKITIEYNIETNKRKTV